MSKQYVMNLEDLKIGAISCVDYEGESVLLANVDGRIYAVSGNCTHEDSSLCLGALKGHHIMCSLHGSLFSLINGEPNGDPADVPLSVYPIEVEDGSIYIVKE